MTRLPAVLADTGPIYALSMASDQHHERAREAMRRIRRERIDVIAPYPIMMEAYSLLLRRTSPNIAHRWLDDVRAGVSWIAPTRRDHEAAADLVSRYEDQAITLFDALLATLSRELGLRVWTFDHHFHVMDVEVWE
jgi:predicted nucleic acid-binding protein